MCGLFVAVFVASFAGRGDLCDDDQKIMSYNVAKKNDIICHPRHLLEEEKIMSYNVAKKAVIICHSQTSRGFWDVCDFVAVLVALLCWRKRGATAMASTGINTMQALFAFSTVLHRAPSPSYSSRRLLNSIAPKLWSAVMIGNNCIEKKKTTWKSHGSRRQGMAVASSSLASSNNNLGSDFVVSEQIEGKSVLLSSPSFLVESQGEEDDKEVSFLKPTTWRASIDFKWIRENKEAVAANIRNRNSSGDVEQVVRLYEQSVSLSQEIDKLRAERNAVASAMKGKLDLARREELIEQGKQLKEQVAELEGKLAVLSERLQQEGQRIPNMTHPSVPIGSEDVASIRKEVGRQREFTFPVKDHVELGLALDLFDFEAASEVSGTKFYYLKNEAVLLELALINWTLSQLLSKGFVPLSTPDLVRSTVVEKCGFQPRGQNTQVYSVEGTDLCLAGTAEIPVGGMYMDSMLPEASLPLKLVAFSHCFRTEAGAAGAATRGLYRVHQFSKLEMFVISRPEDSDILHEELISIEEELYSSLGLHYKTLDMSSEDLGAPAYRKFDIEAWMPGLCRYGEISSASNCTDYQSRRLNIRYRPATPSVAAAQQPPKSKKVKTTLPPLQFVHTLNATACAVPRMIIAILENNQQEDGSVVIPDVLRPFMGGLGLIKPKSR